MNATHQPSLNILRGLFASLLCSLGGAAAAVALPLVFTVCRWLSERTPAFVLQADLKALETDLIVPIIGCAVLGACAGWTTFAPAGKWRFANSLVFLFLVSSSLWFLLGSMQLTPRRYKALQHPILYPSELLVLLGPPLLAGTILTLIRIHRIPRVLQSQKTGG